MFHRFFIAAYAASVWLSLAPVRAATTPKEAGDFFEARIRPLLAKNCYGCHTSAKMGGLQMDSRENLLKGGNDGPVVVPWHPNESLLIQAVRRTNERFKMPPQGQLSEQEVADLAAWVKMGAIWPETGNIILPKSGEYVITPEQRVFWSFQPVRKPPLPKVTEQGWPKSDIDRFILAKLEEKGLKPVKPADKRTLLRRATFDLIGLPPTPEEVDAFLSDQSPNAFAKVVDRLLASPHYGERWGRNWLDYARYADEKFTRGDSRYANAFRYRDWVIQAFNNDMPYDLFVKAQIAGDLLDRPDREKLVAGLGFYALSPQEGDDRVDATTRTFLGLTVACARCHDHKYDPIPTKDYYSLLGVFRSTEVHEIPLAPNDEVERYQKVKKQIENQKEAIKDFIDKQSSQLCDILSAQIAQYLVASWKVITGATMDAQAAADEGKLDRETLERWIKYLKDPEKDHQYLKPWYGLLERHAGLEEVEKFARDFQALVLSFNAEKRAMDDRNYVALGGSAGAKEEAKRQYTNIETLEIHKYYLWRDLESEPYTREAVKFNGGVLYYGPKELDRWLSSSWKDHLVSMRAELLALQKALPKQYPFLHTIKDAAKPADAKVEIRGEADNLGDVAPRRFLRILCSGEPQLFKNGSGRLELAEAIANPNNPLTARVMVNRIWQLHFGQGIVRSVSNFGQLGDRPSHPELLDYLARRFVENHWSIKKLHREIMLSATYALSSAETPENMAVDPDNRLFWRANVVQRLDIEALRDALLFVAGNLDLSIGGPPARLTDDNKRRTVYGFISRNQIDPTLELFDFPDPNNTSERRMATVGPLQRLYFMNSSFIELQAKALAKRLNDAGGDDDAAKITRAYRLLYGRAPTSAEVQLGMDYLRQNREAWPQYAQVLLASSEFSSLN